MIFHGIFQSALQKLLHVLLASLINDVQRPRKASYLSSRKHERGWYSNSVSITSNDSGISSECWTCSHSDVNGVIGSCERGSKSVKALIKNSSIFSSTGSIHLEPVLIYTAHEQCFGSGKKFVEHKKAKKQTFIEKCKAGDHKLYIKNISLYHSPLWFRPLLFLVWHTIVIISLVKEMYFLFHRIMYIHCRNSRI